MSVKPIKLEDARRIARDCERALNIAGRVYVNFPYTQLDLADALVAVNNQLSDDLTKVSREEFNKLQQQKSALQARYVRLARKHGESVAEDTADNS